MTDQHRTRPAARAAVVGLALALAALAALAGPARADRIRLKDGTVYEARKIAESGQTVWIKTAEGIKAIRKSDIAAYEPAGQAEPAKPADPAAAATTAPAPASTQPASGTQLALGANLRCYQEALRALNGETRAEMQRIDADTGERLRKAAAEVPRLRQQVESFRRTQHVRAGSLASQARMDQLRRELRGRAGMPVGKSFLEDAETDLRRALDEAKQLAAQLKQQKADLGQRTADRRKRLTETMNDHARRVRAGEALTPEEIRANFQRIVALPAPPASSPTTTSRKPTTRPASPHTPPKAQPPTTKRAR